MAFKTRRDEGQDCPKCKAPIGTGEWVLWADADRKILQHQDCDESNAGTDPNDRTVRWESVTGESLDRANLLELEEFQVAPIGPQGTCPQCFLELPKSKICGTC